jgi:hypothetical protein
MHNGISSGCSAVSVKCQLPSPNRLAGLGRLMDDTVGGGGGGGLSGGSRGLCSFAHVSGALGMKHVVAQF